MMRWFIVSESEKGEVMAGELKCIPFLRKDREQDLVDECWCVGKAYHVKRVLWKTRYGDLVTKVEVIGPCDHNTCTRYESACEILPLDPTAYRMMDENQISKEFNLHLCNLLHGL